MSQLQKADCVVIGAGWHGLVAAKTFLELNPLSEVVLLELALSVGGVWAKERLYPTLKSNNTLGTYEYSGFPMDTETYGVKPGQHIPGEVVHRYLTNYSEAFGIYKKIQFGTKVESAERQDGGGWLITASKDFQSPQVATKLRVFASKLIVATGMTSDPFLPSISGADSFQAPLFHPKESLKYASALETVGTVCVYGGTKSAWDMVYAHASKGQRVEWVIRESGHGPVWMAPAYVTPLKKLLEKLVLTRLLTWFSPCAWGHADGWARTRSFLHQTWIGRFIVDRFWAILKGDVVALNKFDAHPETAKLKPWTNPFFIGAGLSILNYPTDIFQFVRDGTVRVHIADITSLGPKKVNLSNGDSLPVDALICCTGWKHSPPLKFSPANEELGLPCSLGAGIKTELTEKADQEILSRFPRLKKQPAPNPLSLRVTKPEGITEGPFALYRFMIPPKLANSHDIAFSGCIMTISTAICSQTQALWIAAYFSNKVALSSEVSYSAIRHSRFVKWRYPAGFGSRFPDMAFDSLPYYDMLLRDLGLNQNRKIGSISNIFYPYGPEDYKGVVREWIDADATNKTK